MSAKDFKSKSPMRGWMRRRDTDAAGDYPARDADLEEAVRSGLKIYRFELTAASEPVLPLSAAKCGKISH